MTGIWIFLFELRYLKVREKKWQRTRLCKPIYQKYPIYEAKNAAIKVPDLNLTDFIRFPEFQFLSEHSHVQSLRKLPRALWMNAHQWLRLRHTHFFVAFSLYRMLQIH